MNDQRDFDIVLWGATGFTGKLTAEYLLRKYGAGGELRWALGGRNQAKLARLREQLERDVGPEASKLEFVTGDSSDAASMQQLAERTRVVCTTVGPYALYGSQLLAACARAGTHYCDLTGEVFWIRHMIDEHEAEARASGARIVPTCGFDSIPSDLGVWYLQREMKARYGVHASDVRLGVKAFKGAASGGTVASMLNMFEEASQDHEIARILRDPHALTPARKQKASVEARREREQIGPEYDSAFEQWTAPFVMAAVNTRVVRRSAALLSDLYGSDFHYRESMLMGAGPAGWAKATGLSGGLGAVLAAGAVGPLRKLLERALPDPGEGPSKAEQEAGFYDLRLWGGGGRDTIRVKVTGDRDPGYGSTSKMLGESAVCLARDALDSPGGLLTPASAMGAHLHERLVSNAGLSFEVLD